MILSLLKRVSIVLPYKQTTLELHRELNNLIARIENGEVEIEVIKHAPDPQD